MAELGNKKKSGMTLNPLNDVYLPDSAGLVVQQLLKEGDIAICGGFLGEFDTFCKDVIEPC